MTEAPTKARYAVIAFAVTLAVITYIDRVSISQAMPFISKELSRYRFRGSGFRGSFVPYLMGAKSVAATYTDWTWVVMGPSATEAALAFTHSGSA